jgi:hypothetical protein
LAHINIHQTDHEKNRELGIYIEDRGKEGNAATPANNVSTPIPIQKRMKKKTGAHIRYMRICNDGEVLLYAGSG